MINRVFNRQPIPIQNNQDIKQNNINNYDNSRLNNKFRDVFKEQLEKNTRLNLSDHVNQRLQQRNISLSNEDLNRLETAVNQIAQKGAKESLLLMDDVSYIVNITKRTVITALDKESAKNNIFTNIDSAMIVK